MRNLYSLVFILLFVFIFSACSDDEKKVRSAKQTLDAYLKKAGFVVNDTVTESDDFYEFGLGFTPRVDGSIDEIYVRLPLDHNELRVTIWDAETQIALHTIYLVDVKAHIPKTLKFPALEIEAEHPYAITFNAEAWYNYARPNGSSAAYPITSGDLIFLYYGYVDGTDQQFLTEFPDDYYAGDLSFVFKAK